MPSNCITYSRKPRWSGGGSAQRKEYIIYYLGYVEQANLRQKKRAEALFFLLTFQIELEIHSCTEFVYRPVVLREEQHVGVTHKESRRLVINVRCIQEERRRVVVAELV